MSELLISVSARFFIFFLVAIGGSMTIGRDGLASPSRSPERHATVFYTAEAHGTLEPCGCTSDPLGDFARVSALVRQSAGSQHSTLVVDAGNLLYPAGDLAPARRAGARLRARFLAEQLGRLPLGGVGLGETDLRLGSDAVAPKRLCANLAPSAAGGSPPDGSPAAARFVEPSRIVEVAKIKIGIAGLVARETAAQAGLSATDPVSAARAETMRLHARGAEVVILLAPLDRPAARNIARSAGADFVVVGQNVGSGMNEAEPVGAGFLLAPAQELERVGKLEIVLRGRRDPTLPLIDASRTHSSPDGQAELHQRIARLAQDLARWQSDRASDASFVAAKQAELQELRDEQSASRSQHGQPPARGSYFVNSLLPIRRNLPRDPTLSSAMRRLDRAIGAANLAAAAPPAPAEPGRAAYVGEASCVACHAPAARFWRKTVHAQAWRTLVEVGKEAHDDCVSCHVTGYGEVGGSSLGHTHGLEDVQCEVCHGPGSLHVEKKGRETPFAVQLLAPESVCLRCHNDRHSDTFQYQAYLRDVLGPGHGEDARDKLGQGPTGRQLRHAAQTRAKALTQVHPR